MKPKAVAAQTRMPKRRPMFRVPISITVLMAPTPAKIMRVRGMTTIPNQYTKLSGNMVASAAWPRIY
jgi:hypothetical protein